MRNILIAIPTIDYIESATFKSIYDLTIPLDVQTHFETFRGYGIEHIRNIIAKYALDKQYDYVFCVDSDILLPKNALERLLEHNRDVVSGVYARKQPGQKIVEVFVRQGTKLLPVTLDVLQPPGLHRVNACGLGCALIKTDVFRKIPFPQFEYYFSINPQSVISEDTDFCQKVYEAGKSVWVDSTVLCGHVGKMVYVP